MERNILRTRTLLIDLDSRILSSKTSSVELTASEFSIMKTLMGRPGRIFTRNELQQHLTENQRGMDTRAIDVHIKNVRRKAGEIGASSDVIQSIRGVGYKCED